jgi:hypothetical protein
LLALAKFVYSHLVHRKLLAVLTPFKTVRASEYFEEW